MAASYPPGQHPNSRKNLRPWKPGQSGNPGGRPKGSEFTRAVQKRLREPARDPKTGEVLTDEDGNVLTVTDLLADRFVDNLLAGVELDAMKPLVDREWPVPKAVQHEIGAGEVRFHWRGESPGTDDPAEPDDEPEYQPSHNAQAEGAD